MCATVLDEFSLESGAGRYAFDGLYDGFDLLAELVVRDAEHRRVDEAGMHRQEVLRLLRVDVHPAGDDHERRAIGEIQVAVAVDVAHVSERSPAAVIADRRGLLRILEVLELRSTLEEQLTRLAHR